MGLRDILSGFMGKRVMSAADVQAGYQRGYQQAALELAAGGAMPGPEKGSEGLAHFAGRTTEPYLGKLEWPDAYDVYDEMRRRDPTLRSIVHVTKLLGRTARWKVETATDKPGDREAGEFLSACLEDMSHTVGDFIDDAFTALPFGWSSFELVYKRRDDDGRVGWRKLAYRRQSTFDAWLFDDRGGFAGWVQMAPPAYQEVTLPIEKLLHIVLERDGANPEGMSLFESAYEAWHYVVNLQVISGIGWQRAFVGLPIFKYTEKPGSDDSGIVKAIGEGLRVGAKQFVSVPPGMDFELASTSNSGADSLLRTIQFYRTLMAQMCLADFIMLGMGSGGSWSLGSDKSALFLMAVDGFLDRIAEIWNAWGVRRLFAYNDFPGMTEMPRLTHTKVQKIRLGDLGSFIQQIAPYVPLYQSDGVWLREQAGMPQPAEDAEILNADEEKNEDDDPDQQPDDDADGGDDAERQPPDGKRWEYPEERRPVGEAAEFAEMRDEERAAIEAKLAGRVQRFMKGQRSRILARAQDPAGMDANFWAGETEALKQELLSELLRSILTLVGMAVEDAEEQFAGGADWGMVNADAAKWARQYVGELIRGVTETTKAATRETVATWIETGEALPALEQALEPLFGARRAALIATTEVTRAFDEANDLVRQRVGLPATAVKAPAHPGCRCYTRPVMLPNGEWVVVWSTARDEVVCIRPLDMPWGGVQGCRDLHGVIVSEGPHLGKTLDEVKRGMKRG